MQSILPLIVTAMTDCLGTQHEFGGVDEYCLHIQPLSPAEPHNIFRIHLIYDPQLQPAPSHFHLLAIGRITHQSTIHYRISNTYFHSSKIKAPPPPFLLRPPSSHHFFTVPSLLLFRLAPDISCQAFPVSPTQIWPLLLLPRLAASTYLHPCLRPNILLAIFFLFSFRPPLSV